MAAFTVEICFRLAASGFDGALTEALRDVRQPLHKDLAQVPALIYESIVALGTVIRRA